MDVDVENPHFEHIFTFLKRAAVADAKHDFDKRKLGEFNLKRDPSRIPGFPEVLMGLDESKHQDIPDEMESKLTILKLLLKDDSDIDNLKGELKTGTKTLKINGLTESSYTTKILSDHGETDTNKMETLTLYDLANFFESKVLNLVIDASSLGIMELISSLKRDEENDIDFTINLLINREGINDPAGKMSAFKKIPDELTGKLFTHVLIDRDPYEIQYTRNSPGLEQTHLQRDKFFSVLDFNISPVMFQQNQNNKITSKGSIKVDILQSDGKRVYYNTDPKRSNTIEGCWNLIMNAFKTSPKRLEAAAYFQSKRSGDWFQALSCLDTSRQYGNTMNGEIMPIKGEITLVTHDIILLSYALFMGVDVLFTHFSKNVNEHSLLYFRNETNPNRQSSEDRNKQILDQASAYITKGIEAHYEFMNKYDGWVEEIIDSQTKKINKVLQETTASKSPEYFKELWKLISMKYHKYTETRKALEELKTTITRDPSPENIQRCERILSYKSVLDGNILKAPNKKSIMQKESAYNNDYLFKTMVSPTSPIKIGRGKTVNNTVNATAMVEAFRSRLPLDLFKQFIEKCREWKELHKDTECVIHTIVELTQDDFVLEDCDVNCVQLNALLEIVNNIVSEGALNEEEIEETNNLEPLEEGEILDVKTIFGFDVSNLSERVYKYLTRLDGGGKREINRSNKEQAKSMLYSLLINVFLRTLSMNFSEIDSESNFDFAYYEKLILLINQLFKVFHAPHERAYILYTYIPNFKENKRYGMIGYLANQLCLQALGVWDLEKSLPFVKIHFNEDGPIEGLEHSKHIEDFLERKEKLSKMIYNEFEEIEVVEEPEKQQSVHRGFLGSYSKSYSQKKRKRNNQNQNQKTPATFSRKRGRRVSGRREMFGLSERNSNENSNLREATPFA